MIPMKRFGLAGHFIIEEQALLPDGKSRTKVCVRGVLGSNQGVVPGCLSRASGSRAPFAASRCQREGRGGGSPPPGGRRGRRR
jgi:hypothetical protein